MNHPNVDTKKNDNRLFGGKTVVVTGGARGIGKNICRSFGRSGSKVIICDINEDNGYKTETEFKDENIDVQFYQTDLSKKNAPGQVIRNIIRTHGKIDILVNNARSGPRLDLFEENEETWEQGIAVTLRAAFFCSQEAMRNMIVSGGGSIVNIGSIAAFLYCHESPVYHIAKAGLVQMTRYLASYGGKNRISGLRSIPRKTAIMV
jgi:3-oxoacyl-[acyl-carrier protein] reductase